MIDKKDDNFLETNIKGLMMTLLAHWNEQMDEGRASTEFAEIRHSDMRVFGQLRGKGGNPFLPDMFNNTEWQNQTKPDGGRKCEQGAEDEGANCKRR